MLAAVESGTLHGLPAILLTILDHTKMDALRHR
jgi:hypothetical protein